MSHLEVLAWKYCSLVCSFHLYILVSIQQVAFYPVEGLSGHSNHQAPFSPEDQCAIPDRKPLKNHIRRQVRVFHYQRPDTSRATILSVAQRSRLPFKSLIACQVNTAQLVFELARRQSFPGLLMWQRGGIWVGSLLGKSASFLVDCCNNRAFQRSLSPSRFTLSGCDSDRYKVG